jgi:hypothetical protein
MKSSLIKVIAITIAVSASSIASASSLNQAAWVPSTSTYKFGYNSIPNIPIINAPADTDWKRWAMLHDGSAYRLYFFKKYSTNKLYQFAFNRSKNAYQYGYNSIPVLTLVNAPQDADFSSFSMLHDGSDYRFYVQQKGNPKALYQFAWVPGTATYKFGYRSIPKISVTGFPTDTNWKKWQMLHDGSAYRFYAFKSGSETKFYQGAFNYSTQKYQYGYKSIPVLNLVGTPAGTNKHSAAMLHDGSAYRFYFQGR